MAYLWKRSSWEVRKWEMGTGELGDRAWNSVVNHPIDR